MSGGGSGGTSKKSAIGPHEQSFPSTQAGIGPGGGQELGYDSKGGVSTEPIRMSEHLGARPAHDTLTSSTVTGEMWEGDRSKAVDSAFAAPVGSSMATETDAERAAAGPIVGPDVQRDQIKYKLNADVRHLKGGLAEEGPRSR
jgi:hypothetical protein